jgi:hypothetical protein
MADAHMLKEKVKLKGFEASILGLQIKRARLEAEMSRLQLLCQGIQDESVIPASLCAGGNFGEPSRQFLEHRRLIEWLSEVCDTTSRRDCHVHGDLCVAGSKAIIGQGVQWSLSVQHDLNLTFPTELESMMLDLLSKARSSLLSLDDLEELASMWDMVSVEMVVDDQPIPGLFLIRKEDAAAIVVSAWPKLHTPTAAPTSRSVFDAAEFFRTASNAKSESSRSVALQDCNGLDNTLHFAPNGIVHWDADGTSWQQASVLGINFCATVKPESEKFCLQGPFGRAVFADSKQRWEAARDIVSLSLESGIHVYTSPSSDGKTHTPDPPWDTSCDAHDAV